MEESDLELEHFFAKVAPGKWVRLEALAGAPEGYFQIDLPPIRLDCGACGGVRRFRNKSNLTVTKSENHEFITYTCQDCEREEKHFSVVTRLKDPPIKGPLTAPAKGLRSVSIEIHKMGEYPPFGSRLPSKVLSLLGPDQNLFIKGKSAEEHDQGIGAFAYYRRVVENQKDRIFGEIFEVAAKMGAEPVLLERLRAARKEKQFTKAVESMKDAFPAALLIDGHNPLKVLHTALSHSVHNESDEECLAKATTIREVLIALSDRIADLNKERRSISTAIGRLLNQPKPDSKDRRDTPSLPSGKDESTH